MNGPTRPTAEIALLGQEIYRGTSVPRLKPPTRAGWSPLTWIPGTGPSTTRLLPRRTLCENGVLLPTFWVVKVGHPTLRTFGAVLSGEYDEEGLVNANKEAVVSLTIRGPEGRSPDVNAVIDTGYSGFLTLPAAWWRN